MSIYLNKDSKIIVQGMTGGMGAKHTTLMVESGANIVVDGDRARTEARGERHQRVKLDAAPWSLGGG